MTVAMTLDRSLLKIRTMCRSPNVSAISNMYVPAGRTFPGISNGWLNVRIDFLFKSSARALVGEASTSSDRVNPIHSVLLIIPSISF